MLTVHEVSHDLDPFDLMGTFLLQRCGKADPTMRLSPKGFLKHYAGRDGPVLAMGSMQGARLYLRLEGAPHDVEWAAQLWRAQVDPTHQAFAPTTLTVKRRWRDARGVRVMRMPWLHDLFCSFVLQQRVTYFEACAQWRAIARAHGEPGLREGLCFPSAARLRRVPLSALMELGIDRARAQTLLAVAREAGDPVEWEPDLGRLCARLDAIRGVGPWTLGMLRGYGLGDADAVIVGDVHLPHAVCKWLADEPHGSDERMLELLEPYRGHRLRLARMALLTGL
jgi:3-methyladenine DNA glycosylase/8-oxoguanine DNA glycosylase